ncbi:putative photosystem I [Helianthus anomalus]
MSALGRPQDMFSDTAIQLQTVFAQWIQNTHAIAPGATCDTPGKSVNNTAYLASSVSAYQISGRNFF